MQKISTYSEKLGPSSWVESSFSLGRYFCACPCANWAAEDGGATVQVGDGGGLWVEKELWKSFCCARHGTATRCDAL